MMITIIFITDRHTTTTNKGWLILRSTMLVLNRETAFIMQQHTNEILITNDSVLSDIQNAFTIRFPFLKIDFLQAGSVRNPGRSSTLDPQTCITKITTVNLPHTINIDSKRTISDVANDFKNSLELFVQLSRKSGKVWNVISVTAGWTLESQNSAGEFITSQMEGFDEQN